MPNDPVVSETTPGAKLRSEKARQGQNVRGMLTVLVVSLALLGGAYAVLLAMSAQRASHAAPAATTTQTQQ